MKNTPVKEIMSPRPKFIAPDATLYEACIRMKDVGCGVLPVGSDNDPEGIITDRDIIVRALAAGVDPAIAMVKDYMSPTVHACKEDDDLQSAAKLMNTKGVSRLVVRDKDNNVSGILSFGHLLRSKADNETVAEVVCCAVGRKKAA